MRKLLLAASGAAALLSALSAHAAEPYASAAQGARAVAYVVVASCATPPETYTVGLSYMPTMDTTGKVCTNASVSAGGGGDASAANQTSQITQETNTNTILGAVTASPTQYTIGDRLKTLNASIVALGSPFQAGGNIGNTSFGASQTGTWTVGLNGTLPAFASTPTFNVGTTGGLALDATVGGLVVAQGSTTSGQKGVPAYCAVTTSNPSYTTAQTNSLSCDTAGNLRITAPATAPVNVVVNTPPNDVLVGPTAVTGAADVIVNSQGAGSTGLQITGTFTGLSGIVRATVDGTNYFNIPAFNTTGGAAVTPGTAITGTGSWFIPAAGWRSVEFHVTAVSTGTVNVSLNSSAGSIQPLITPSGASGVDVLGVNGTSVATSNGTANAQTLRVAIASNNSTLTFQGGAANNASPSGNPNLVSGIAQSAEPTAATNGQNAQLATDLAHKLITLPYANPENFVSGTTAAMTSTTSTLLLASPGGSLRNYITQLTCVNSHATVGTFVTIQDGSGGTALYTLAAGSVYGGNTITFPVPLRQPTTATGLYVADVTTGANVICSATGYKGL